MSGAGLAFEPGLSFAVCATVSSAACLQAWSTGSCWNTC